MSDRSSEEVRSFVSCATHPLDRAMIAMLTKTGVGVGELCNLDLSDVDLRDPEVSETYSLPPREWNPTERPFVRVRYGGDRPFNNRRERTRMTLVPLDRELSALLKRWLAIRPDAIAESDPLFVNTREDWGRRTNPSHVRYALQKLGEDLGHYEEGAERDNLTPLALRYVFVERFEGQPDARGTILGVREPSRQYGELSDHYRDRIFRLFPSEYASRFEH